MQSDSNQHATLGPDHQLASYDRPGGSPAQGVRAVVWIALLLFFAAGFFLVLRQQQQTQRQPTGRRGAALGGDVR